MTRPDPARAGRRARRATVLLGLAGALLAVLAGTRTWVRVAGVPILGDVTVGGRQAAPVVVAIALAAAVCALVLGTAGRTARLAVGALLLLGGVLVGWTAVATAGDPDSAAAPALARATGTTSGPDLPARATPWPWAAAAGGVLTAAAGALALATGRSWPAGGRRFERPADGPAEGPAGSAAAPAEEDPAGLWDALSRGEDPS